MSHESAWAGLSALSARNEGVFRGRDAESHGISRDRLTTLQRTGVIVRELADTYRLAGAPRTELQPLVAALLWGGPDAAAAGRSAGRVNALEGVVAPIPEIVVPRKRRLRAPGVIVHQNGDHAALMVRRHKGFRVTGVEATLVALAALLDDEAFEIACEDARRRQLTSIPALRAYLDRHGRAGRPGVTTMRRLLRELDPAHPARSTLEVKTRRLLVAHGVTDYVREFPLEWNGRAFYFDFAFTKQRTILETNGRRWHDDAVDYEHDNEKWSVPGRHGYRLARRGTWSRVAPPTCSTNSRRRWRRDRSCSQRGDERPARERFGQRGSSGRSANRSPTVLTTAMPINSGQRRPRPASLQRKSGAA
jgi:hypothetical protein